MKRVLIVGLVAVGGGLFAVRGELLRYIRIRRIGQNPALVGVSTTPQGNEAALRKSPIQRQLDRVNAGIRPATRA
jgi:hypothetical protein